MPEVSRNLNTEEEKIFNRHRGTIQRKSRRSLLRVEYFDMKHKVDLAGFSIPEHMRDVKAALGWPNKACSVTARRVRPEGFTLTTPSELLKDLDEIMVTSHLAKAERLAFDSMMLHSVSFLFASPGRPELGEPEVVVSVCSAMEATAERDKRTGRITSALEVVSNTEHLLYLPGKTLRVQSLNHGKWTVTFEYLGVEGRVMCTPYIWRESLARPFGYSRVSRAVMDLTDRFIRSSIREEVNADLFSVPRMAMTNADESSFFDADGKRISPLAAMMGAVWGIPGWRDDETGTLIEPKLQQFAQASFEPHQAMRRGIAMEFSGEADIPVGQLGIVQDNPSSAEAIIAAENSLVTLMDGELPLLANAREDFARNVLMVKHGKWTPEMEKSLISLRAHFGDPGTPTRSAQADAGMKIITAVPDIVGTGVDLEVLGLDVAQIETITAARKKNQAASLIDKLLASPPAPAADPVAPNQQPAPPATE